MKDSTISSASAKLMTTSARPINYCRIVIPKQDLKKQKTEKKKIVDEEYLRALKNHNDPRKLNKNTPFEVNNSIDKLVHDKIKSMSLDHDQRLSFEKWVKYKTIQQKLKKKYYKQKLNINEYEKQNSDENFENLNQSSFNNWVKNKIKEKKLRKKDKIFEMNQKILEKEKHIQEGTSYRQWLKISLQKEKEFKKYKKIMQEKEDLEKHVLEEQRSYERRAKRYIEKKEIRERLSKLNVKKPPQTSADRRSTSPLLLAYSPNKYNKIQDYSIYLSRQQVRWPEDY
jgi:hypothetical protein